MPSSDIFIAFITAAAVFAYMPGPSTLYAAARTLAGGRRAGWLAAAGIHVGGYVHVLTTAFGLSVLFIAIPVLYVALKIGGAVYLIWLGISLWRTKVPVGDATMTTVSHGQSSHSTRRLFRDSAVVEILNPKTAMFYLAFLPQFTDAGAAFPVWLQLLVLGTLVNIMFSSADILCVLLAAKIQEAMSASRSATRWAHRLGGAVLIGLGIKLAATRL